MDGLVCDHSSDACRPCRESGLAYDPIGDVGRAVSEAQQRLAASNDPHAVADLRRKQAEAQERRDRPTLRDRFAMAALTGLVRQGFPMHEDHQVVQRAFAIADWAMIARERKP